jgi:crotonobetainyl-CoA:carnitine CoA-transferase CaiB-like acyl-CoA transferase
MTSITDFGQTGPYRDHRAYHITIFNATEGSNSARKSDGRPTVAGGYLGEYDTGLNAGMATLAALYAAWYSGEGQHVDISRFESLAALQRVDISIRRNQDRVADYRRGARIGGLVPCKDGWVVISVVEDHQWSYLVEMMGNPEWAKDPALSDREARPKHAATIQPHIIAWTKQHTKLEIFEMGQAAKCPVGAVLTMAELFESPQLQARHFFHEVHHPEAGLHLQPGMAFMLSASPWEAVRPAPLLGQHNDEVLGPLAASPRDGAAAEVR